MEELLYTVELPLIEVLASMECEGFRVDENRLTEIGEKFKKEIETLEKEIHELADEEFNIKSPKQLGKILRSEEHTSELQSRQYLVCRLLLEKKNTATA